MFGFQKIRKMIQKKENGEEKLKKKKKIKSL